MDGSVRIKQEPQDASPVQDGCTALLLRTESLNTIHLVTGGTVMHPSSGQMATMSLPQGKVAGQVLNLNAVGGGHQTLTAAPLPSNNTPMKLIITTKSLNQMKASSDTNYQPLFGTGNQPLVLGPSVSATAPLFSVKNTSTAFTVSGQKPSPRKIAVISVPSLSKIPAVGQQVSTVDGNLLTVTNNLVSKAHSSIQSISPLKITLKSSPSLQPQQPQHPVFFSTSQPPNLAHPTVFTAAPLDIAQFKGMPSSSAHLQILSNDGKYQYVKLVTTPSEEVKAITSSAGATEPVKFFIPSSKATSYSICSIASTSTQASQKTCRPLQAAQRSILPATFQPKNELCDDPHLGAAKVQLAPGTPRKMPNGTFIMTQMTNDYPPNKSIKLDPEMFPEPSSATQSKAALCSANDKLKRPCNCSKSQCLKLYCECFAMGEFCNNCNCNNCFNNLENEEHRQQAIRACLDRNPQAFHPKIGKNREGEIGRQHCKGCHCKRSGCQKNYCECYEAKILCSDFCKCFGCKNCESSASRKSLMHLADAAEVRVQQQLAATTRLDSHLEDLPCKPSRESSCRKRPHMLITEDVADAVTGCLIATAEMFENEEAEPSSFADAERLLLTEFGRCIERVISIAATANA